MTLRRLPVLLAALALTLHVGAAASSAAGAASYDWLRGSGKDLQIRLRGEVIDADAQPAARPSVSACLHIHGSDRSMEATVADHRFELWVPVNRVRLYCLWLKAKSADGERVAYKRLLPGEIRQAAIDGLTLSLQPPTRHVDVEVLADGRPVPGALVKARLDFALELESHADAKGIARLELLPDQELSELAAWTSDFRAGAFSFARDPDRDPKADQQVVEVRRCQNQRLRFVDENGSPAAGLDLVVWASIMPPDGNLLTTDATGEVVYRWYPKEPTNDPYIDLRSNEWFLTEHKDTIDGVKVWRVKRSKGRRQIDGRVVSTETDPGGFFVSLSSFQSEREYHGDDIDLFANADGTFSVDVLPDATYCAYVLDCRWAGQVTDLVPYRSASKQATPPVLSVSKGQQVDVIVTTGPQKRPLPNFQIRCRREHVFKWEEKGDTRTGSSGPVWSLTTDETGRATACVLPGKLNLSVYTPIWRVNKEVDVAADKPTKIAFHRELEAKRKVTGQLRLADGVEADLNGLEIQIGAVDGHFQDRETLKSDKQGIFSFETAATEIALFAQTKDARAAGSTIVTDFDSPVKLVLRPTVDYRGQLLGKNDRPLVGHAVHAVVRVGHHGYSMIPRQFDVARVEAKTDRQGNYTLHGVPVGTMVSLYADGLRSGSQAIGLDEVYLEPDESRPRAINRLASVSRRRGQTPLAKRYEAVCRDCALMGFRPMVILRDDAKETKRFVRQNLLDYEKNMDVATFIQLEVDCAKGHLNDADRTFLEGRNWRPPGQGRIAVYAADATGNELGRLELNLEDKDAAAEAAAFVKRHVPPTVDSEKKWHDALAESKRLNRRLWARISQRYCGPCFRLARWMDDHRELLAKDYVMLKIDNVRDEHGQQTAERLTRGEHHGIPFCAIFDADGTMLIDSAGPLGNIGYPSGFEGKRHFRRMLLATRQNLSDAEIDQLVDSLPD